MGYYECFPEDLEFNFCSIPMQGFKEIGGCDEYLDAVGYDVVNLNVTHRLDMIGYKFFIDQSLEVKGLVHEKHPDDWNAKLTIFNGEYDKRKQYYSLANNYKLCYI